MGVVVGFYLIGFAKPLRLQILGRQPTWLSVPRPPLSTSISAHLRPNLFSRVNKWPEFYAITEYHIKQLLRTLKEAINRRIL